MKKALSLVLALALCLSLIPMTVFAYGNEWIQLDKDNYDPNEEMVVAIKGVTQQMVDDWACLAIFNKGHTESYGGGYPEVSNAGDSVIDYMTAPVEPGEYEVVLLSKWWQNGDFADLLVTSVPFTVGKITQEGHISLDKTAYTATNPITVSYSGITEQMVNAKAFIRIEEKGVLHGSVATVNHGSGTITINAPNVNGEFVMCLYSVDDGNWNATAEYLVMSVPFTVNGAVQEPPVSTSPPEPVFTPPPVVAPPAEPIISSEWAEGTMQKAAQLGLIPDILKGVDLTAPINRGEYAAISVKIFENLTGTFTTPAASNPFSDTGDIEILKSYNHNLMIGISATEFAPRVLLNRETMAAALCKVLTQANILLYGSFSLDYTMPTPFADDANISDWAKNSVYFMYAHGIIAGTGHNMFAPRATTPSEEALNYAVATREQALIIAVRIVENQSSFQQGR